MPDLPANRPLRIATRSSQLALWQARYTQRLLQQDDPTAHIELVEVSTTGDRDQANSLRNFGGLGVFTREVQWAVLDGRADLAVHSLKDLPTQSAEGLTLALVPERATVFDALVLPQGSSAEPTLEALPRGARVGTGSPRRQAQLRHWRPDLLLEEVRGNVETRLNKLDRGEYAALVLASAGLVRLGLAGRISATLSPPVMYPAVSQGALGIECRSDDVELQARLARLVDRGAWQAVAAERALLEALRAGCHAPVGVMSQVIEGVLRLEAVVLTLDGQRRWMSAVRGPAAEAVRLGQTAAALLLDQGAQTVCQSVPASPS
jgi:hydroxymethylbilane synthase